MMKIIQPFSSFNTVSQSCTGRVLLNYNAYSDHFGAFTKETYDEEKKKKKQQICVDHKIVMCEESVMAKNS